jgi:hypothetical protein
LNLVDLVLTVCLVASPHSCRDEHLYFESRGSLFQCMVAAPTHIARWAAGRPALRVVRWKCEYPDGGFDI